MSLSSMSRSYDVSPIPLRERTLEDDFPTQEHPPCFSQETPFVQVPREDLARLKDLRLELNQVALRQELLLAGIERKVPPCQNCQGREPTMPSPTAPVRDAQVRVAQSPEICWSPICRCFTHRSPFLVGQGSPSCRWSRRLQGSRSHAGRMKTPRPELVDRLGACTPKDHPQPYQTSLKGPGRRRRALEGKE